MIIPIIWVVCTIINFIIVGYMLGDMKMSGDLAMAIPVFLLVGFCVVMAAPIVTLVGIGVFLRGKLNDK